MTIRRHHTRRGSVLLHHKTRLLRARVELLTIAVVTIAVAVTIVAAALIAAIAVAVIVLLATAIAGLPATQWFDMTRNQFAIKNMAFEFDRVTSIYTLGTAQAFGVYIDIGAGTVFQKTVTLRYVEPLDCCSHNVIKPSVVINEVSTRRLAFLFLMLPDV